MPTLGLRGSGPFLVLLVFLSIWGARMTQVQVESEIKSGQKTDVDVVVVGAGFSGLCMLHMLREAGFTAQVFEAGDGVGGTWFWNRYPGARVDLQSVEYSFSFAGLQDEWDWTELMAPSPNSRLT